jgi:hypothetical protein
MSVPNIDTESSSLTAKQRRAIYGVIICITLGIVASRIATITRDGKTPMLSQRPVEVVHRSRAGRLPDVCD